jgi:hypothetical protein
MQLLYYDLPLWVAVSQFLVDGQFVHFWLRMQHLDRIYKKSKRGRRYVKVLFDSTVLPKAALFVQIRFKKAAREITVPSLPTPLSSAIYFSTVFSTYCFTCFHIFTVTWGDFQGIFMARLDRSRPGEVQLLTLNFTDAPKTLSRK